MLSFLDIGRNLLGIGAALLVSGLATPAQAQFSSGSDGSDGAISYGGGIGVIILEKGDLDPDGDGVFHFTTINIGTGTEVRVRNAEFGTRPLIWLATGDVTISGTLSVDGEDGVSRTQGRVAAKGGAGGYNGGLVAASGNVPTSTAGDGPGGGARAINFDHRGGGGGHAMAGTTGAGDRPGGPAYGNEYLLPLSGGSGGGGAPETGNYTPGNGGAGGGSLLLASSGTITIDGTIRANGGRGGEGSGSGSGGGIRLVANRITGAGNISALGGDTNLGGTQGATGRIRLEAFQLDYTRNTTPPAFTSSPGILFLPPGAPSVRLVRIAGVDVAASPTGSFQTPDAVINASGQVTLELSATGIPTGTVIKLRLVPESGEAVNIDSTPLAGTPQASTATATATLPPGFSRFTMTATWPP